MELQFSGPEGLRRPFPTAYGPCYSGKSIYSKEQMEGFAQFKDSQNMQR